jgi:hypothetical protein
VIKEKVLSEIFELENVEDDLKKLLNSPIKERIDEEFRERLFKDVERQESNPLFKRKEKDEENLITLSEMMSNRFRRNTRKSSSLNDDFNEFFHRTVSKDTNDCSLSLRKDNNSSNLFKNKIEEEIEQEGVSDIIQTIQSLQREVNNSNTSKNNLVSLSSKSVNANSPMNKPSCISNSNNSFKTVKAKIINSKNSVKYRDDKENNLNLTGNSSCTVKSLKAVNKKNIPQLDSFQMKLLFKDFITDENVSTESGSMCDFKDQLKDGVYCEHFYQNVYCKYNGLSESLANKRKHVCLKLLNILKLIVSLR